MIEKETDYSKLCLESRWSGALHLQCCALIYSESKAGKIPLSNPEPWPWHHLMSISRTRPDPASTGGLKYSGEMETQ